MGRREPQRHLLRTRPNLTRFPPSLERKPNRKRRNPMSSVAVTEPSLSSRAMLCSLSISMWSARKHDPAASEEIASRHGAKSDAGRYNKVLLPKQALAEIQKIVSEARHEHYFITLPWADDGYRVLPAAA